MNPFKVGDEVRGATSRTLFLVTEAEPSFFKARPIQNDLGQDPDIRRVHFDEYVLRKAAQPVRTLKGDVKAVFQALCDGTPWGVGSLKEFVMRNTGRAPSDSTITARIRDLRKPAFGGFKIEREQQGKLHFYRMVK
jgi:hypothetical protein